MRKVSTTIDSIINRIKELQGQNIDLEVSRGRKKTIKYTATIENIYPSIFTVRSTNRDKSSFSYSYADVLCGAVSFKESVSDEELKSI